MTACVCHMETINSRDWIQFYRICSDIPVNETDNTYGQTDTPDRQGDRYINEYLIT